ncbi:MAG TPA: DUF2163 domain-containing protein, partial [Novosphingobium sp.]|nr:DUF2163 domain-containing protein [Novosphingobium sp.]
QALETVATFWRVARRDGVTLGFTTHDHDLWFDGVLHRATPGMVPSAIRRNADLEPDSAEVEGALSHDSISADDLAAGRFDGAAIAIGLVDWEVLETSLLYRGTIGAVSEEAGRFSAELLSRKAELASDSVPRTAPTCRARFCGPGCGLSAARFTHEAVVTASDPGEGSVTVTSPASDAAQVGGTLRWIDGPQAGQDSAIVAASGGVLLLDRMIDPGLPAGMRAELREGCDHTLATCASRFANAVNFQGEPFLPGNDLVTRYPAPAG